MVETLYCKALRNWELGERLLSSQDYDAAANRLYYGLFQAAKAHLVEEGKLSGDEDSGVHGRVKAHLYTKDQKNTFEDFRALRVTADYCAEHVEGQDFGFELLQRGKAFLKNYLKNHGKDCKHRS